MRRDDEPQLTSSRLIESMTSTQPDRSGGGVVVYIFQVIENVRDLESQKEMQPTSNPTNLKLNGIDDIYPMISLFLSYFGSF